MPLWKLVPLSESPSKVGISESWKACSLLDESLWVAGSFYHIISDYGL